VIDFGLPLQGYTDIDDRYDEQIGKIEDFLDRAEKYLDDEDGAEGMDLRYLSDYLVRVHPYRYLYHASPVRDVY
jgi:hypothetical protein